MKHFETKQQAKKFVANSSTLKIFKKKKGMPNWKKKPFCVGTEFEWLNWF